MTELGDIVKVGGFDPLADPESSSGGKAAAVDNDSSVHIRVQKRNGRKCLTTVQGLPAKFDKKKILKALKKDFCCNGTVVDDPEYGTVIQLQGDQRKNISQFLLEVSHHAVNSNPGPGPATSFSTASLLTAWKRNHKAGLPENNMTNLQMFNKKPTEGGLGWFTSQTEGFCVTVCCAGGCRRRLLRRIRSNCMAFSHCGGLQASEEKGGERGFASEIPFVTSL